MLNNNVIVALKVKAEDKMFRIKHIATYSWFNEKSLVRVLDLTEKCLIV